MTVRLNALRQKQGETHDKMEALLDKAAKENRDFLDEEAQAFKDLEAEFAANKSAIEREEKVEAIKASLAKPISTPGNIPAVAPVMARAVRYGKLKSFKGEKAEEDAYKSGMFLRAAFFGDKGAFDWCREHGVAVEKAAGETVGSTGGYLVPSEFNQTIIDLREEFGTFRKSCRLIPMGSDSMTIPRRAGGLTAYFVAENAEITASDKAWEQVSLNAKKLAALSRLSTELADDAIISIADDLAFEMAYAFAKKEDECGWNGDGTVTYGGIVGARTKIITAPHTASVVDGASGHDTFAEMDAVDLANVMAKLPKYAESNAKWYCSQVCWALVFQRLTAAAGGVTMQELTGGKPTRSYLGYPVVIDQSLPTATTDISDTVMLFFGDLALAATMGERRGIAVKTSGERYFEFDQIGVQATERVDINVHDLGSTTAAGPLIGLIAE